MELSIYQTCYKCHGAKVYNTTSDSGVVVIDPCPVCIGEGQLLISSIDAKKIKKRFDDIDDTLASILDKLNNG